MERLSRETGLGDGDYLGDQRAFAGGGGDRDGPAYAAVRGDGVVDDQPHRAVRRGDAGGVVDVGLAAERAGEVFNVCEAGDLGQLLELRGQRAVRRVVEQQRTAD